VSRQARAPLHEVAVDVFRLRGKDEVLEPVHQIAIVGDASEQGHCRVRVRVDESGKDGGPAGVDGCFRRIESVDIGRWSDRHDHALVDGHRPFLDVRTGHGQDRSAGDEKIDAFWRRGEERSGGQHQAHADAGDRAS